MTPIRRRTIEDMRIRDLAANSQRVCLTHVVRFANRFPHGSQRHGVIPPRAEPPIVPPA
jgi:hypothetical protein